MTLAAVTLQTTRESVSPRREGTWWWNNHARLPLPAWRISPRGRGGFPRQVNQLQTQVSALGGLSSPKLVSSPEVPFVGGILDMVANVVEHPVSRGAVSGIEHLEEVHCTVGFMASSSPPRLPLGSLPIGGEPRAHSSCWPIAVVSTSPLHQTGKNPLRVGMGCKLCGKGMARRGETFSGLVIVPVIRLLGIKKQNKNQTRNP